VPYWRIESVHGLNSATVGFGDDPRGTMGKRKKKIRKSNLGATQEIEDQPLGSASKFQVPSPSLFQ
jgi:hypothetical protein